MVVYEKQPILDKFQTVLNFFRHISYSIMTLFRGLLSSSVSDCSLSVTVSSEVVVKTLLEVVGTRVKSTIVGGSETAVLAVVRGPDSIVVDRFRTEPALLY